MRVQGISPAYICFELITCSTRASPWQGRRRIARRRPLRGLPSSSQEPRTTRALHGETEPTWWAALCDFTCSAGEYKGSGPSGSRSGDTHMVGGFRCTAVPMCRVVGPRSSERAFMHGHSCIVWQSHMGAERDAPRATPRERLLGDRTPPARSFLGTHSYRHAFKHLFATRMHICI